MSRVIQDSDDELDDDIEVDVRQSEKKDASPKQSNSGASSTEALRRQIEAAHRAHLQSQFPTNDSHSSASMNLNHQKRKVPADFDLDLSGTSSANLDSNKASIMYGKMAKGIFSSLPAGEHEEQNLVDQKGHAILSTGTANKLDWVLDGTMREAYALHNPNAMFPEPSSTVPNATMTQQRVLEGVLAPVLLGSDTDVGGTPFQPDASIPWSEYLKSPTNTGEQPGSSAQEPHISGDMSATIPQTLPYVESQQLQVRQSRQASSMPVASPSTQEVVDAQDVTMFPNQDVRMSALQPNPSSASTINGVSQEKPSSSSRQSRKKRLSPGPTSDDDLADLGLPKEQYKPRPSRSRSLKVDTQESIDYSVRPEKAMKSTRRRKSTPASTNIASPLHTPDKIRQVCDMGFTPSTSETALRQNNGDVTQTVDWLITNRVAEDELVSHPYSMSKPGKKQALTILESATHHDESRTDHIGIRQTVVTDTGVMAETLNNNRISAETELSASAVDLRSPAKVQVVIPTRSPNTTVETSQKKPKRRKTTSDQAELPATEHSVTGAKVEKKRGRGRPKKAAKAPVPTDIVQDEEDETSKEQAHGSPLLPVDGNATGQVEVVEQTNAENTEPSPVTNDTQAIAATIITATSRPTPEPQMLPNRPEVEPITPERVKKSAPREQPSNNKSKVPYRVGLSKRTRIAPLLRTIKK